MNISEFEQAVHGQTAVASQHYDAEYFTGEWRDAGNNYNLETRRAIEAKNPALIKDVFQPQRALDLGCGPRAGASAPLGRSRGRARAAAGTRP